MANNTSSNNESSDGNQVHSWKSAKYLSEVRTDPNGHLQWRKNPYSAWKNAVYHSAIRNELIAKANQMGEYKHPRAKGKHVANDVTCFHPDQEEWGVERENWPDILFQFLPGIENISAAKAEYWATDDGLQIISVHNKALLNHRELPHTISSKIEGAFIEAFCRLNKRISKADIRARMVDDPKGGQFNGQGKDPIHLGTLCMRATCFRLNAGCISWETSGLDSTDRFFKYLDKLLPQHCKDANSTKGFRSLHKHEVLEMKLNNVGMFLERGPGDQKDVSTERSLALRREALGKFQKAKAEFEANEAKKQEQQENAHEILAESGGNIDSVDDQDDMESGEDKDDTDYESHDEETETEDQSGSDSNYDADIDEEF